MPAATFDVVVAFEVIEHRDVYTAQERAAVAHISGRLVAKVVVVRDGEREMSARVAGLPFVSCA